MGTVKSYFVTLEHPVIEEIAILQRRVDLISLDKNDGRLIAVEGKVSNWRKAFRQAVSCLLFADNVFIALPESSVHRVESFELEQYGIGLLSVNSHVEIILKAKESVYTSKYYRDQILKRFVS